MLKLRYYCQGRGNTQIIRLLEEMKDKRNISYEIMVLSNSEREKRVYETDFKPRAKILKRRTKKSITELRGVGGKHRYYVSLPGTLAIIKNDQVEWWTYTDVEIKYFLNQALSQGQNFLEKLCTGEVF